MVQRLKAGVKEISELPFRNMVLAVKGLGKLSWMVIRSFVTCADKSS